MLTPIRATLSSFLDVKKTGKTRKKIMFECGEGREIYKQPRQFKVRRNRLLLFTNYALLEKRPTNSGMARPFPLIRAITERKLRFSLDVIRKG